MDWQAPASEHLRPTVSLGTVSSVPDFCYTLLQPFAQRLMPGTVARNS